MIEGEKIEIFLNKKKLVKFLLISILFVLGGIWILVYRPNTNNILFNDSMTRYGVAIIAIVFFGFAAVFFAIRIFSKKPGFIVDKDGIIDQSGTMAAGRIPWGDMISFSTIEMYNQQYLVITVNNADDYIDKQTNIITRKAMKYNYKQYGSPITISVKLLTYNMEELKRILRSELIVFKNNHKGIS